MKYLIRLEEVYEGDSKKARGGTDETERAPGFLGSCPKIDDHGSEER